MSRVVLGFFFISAVLFQPILQPTSNVHAQTTAVVHVMVQLKGIPVAADLNFKVRDAATHGRFRVDPSLPTARWYGRILQNYQTKEIHYLLAQHIQLEVGRRFHLLFNGFSATVPETQLARLRLLTNVAAVLPVRRYTRLLDRSTALVHAPEAWAQLGGAANAGRGIRIADVDSGIDISNPCFSDTGMTPPGNGFPRADTAENRKLTNNKVIVARAFGDTGKTYSAQDMSGHGTFTSSIEACDYNTPTPLGTHISGMAPAAYLLNYNVFPGGGNQTSSSDPVLPALESALLDGADVVNMSLGNSQTGDLRLDADARAVGIVTKAGVSVVASAGNAGPTSQTVGSPAASPEAIAVGASSNAHAVFSSATVLGPGVVPAELQHLKGNFGSKSWNGTVGPAEVVSVGLGRLPGTDKCAPDPVTQNDFAGKDLHGKIALIERGTICFAAKISNAAKQGAVAAIVYDNRVELTFSSQDVGDATLPHLFISQEAGKALLAWVQAHPDAQLTMDSAPSPYDAVPNVLSDFSSRGYGANYAIKPDLVAPGENIYAATQTGSPQGELYNPSGFTSSDGTSFSAPHVAGGVALLLQKHKTWTPGMIKAALMNTSGTDIRSGDQTSVPNIMQTGAGLMNVNAALLTSALVSPASASFGQLNVAGAGTSGSIGMSMTDVGGGAGTWQVSVSTLHGSGAQLSTPDTIALPTGGKANFTVKLSAGATASTGDQDGYIILSRNGQSVHVPYFVHLVNQAIKPGSVLLVDDSMSLFQTTPPQQPVNHLDVSKFYENALTAVSRSYTYWEEAKLGPPSLSDMRKASAVIYFTGNNLNGFGPQNSNYEALEGPLNPTDVTVLHSYLDQGGKVFVSGRGAVLSDPYWSALVMGAGPDNLSLYDTTRNDKTEVGGVSPPHPSAVRDTRDTVRRNIWLFSGFKGIDFSTRGNGARDNLATVSKGVQAAFGSALVGVPGLEPVSGSFGWQGSAHGQAVLRSTDVSLVDSGQDVGIVSSDEASLVHAAKYPGRSVLFSFGFEGINDNTGFATRAQVMRRVLSWLDDKPVAAVANRRYSARRNVTLVATLQHGTKPVQFAWQVGGVKLKPSAHPTVYRFSRAGTYRVRVLITDDLGHTALSGWRTVRAA